MSGAVRGLDGKTYPAAWLPAVDRTALIATVHQMHCLEGLSVRKTLDRIAKAHGVRRSVGWAAAALKNHQCTDCSGVPVGSPEQSATHDECETET